MVLFVIIYILARSFTKTNLLNDGLKPVSFIALNNNESSRILEHCLSAILSLTMVSSSCIDQIYRSAIETQKYLCDAI